MRRKKTMTITDVLAEYKREMNIEGRLKEVDIINSWELIVGKAIASRTTRIYINGRVLHIHLSSSVVRNELMMMKETIRERVNEIAGEELVVSIELR